MGAYGGDSVYAFTYSYVIDAILMLPTDFMFALFECIEAKTYSNPTGSRIRFVLLGLERIDPDGSVVCDIRNWKNPIDSRGNSLNHKKHKDYKPEDAKNFVISDQTKANTPKLLD